jgi:hypothetical protein
MEMLMASKSGWANYNMVTGRQAAMIRHFFMLVVA